MKQQYAQNGRRMVEYACDWLITANMRAQVGGRVDGRRRGRKRGEGGAGIEKGISRRRRAEKHCRKSGRTPEKSVSQALASCEIVCCVSLVRRPHKVTNQFCPHVSLPARDHPYTFVSPRRKRVKSKIRIPTLKLGYAFSM